MSPPVLGMVACRPEQAFLPGCLSEASIDGLFSLGYGSVRLVFNDSFHRPLVQLIN